MADIYIKDMTADSSITGVEILPVSDAGSAKRVTITQVKDFTIAQIEAITADNSTAATGADGVYVLRAGVLKPVDIDLVAQYAIDLVWGKADATPVVADKLVFKTAGGVEKTATFTNLAELIRATIEAAVLDITSLGAASALTGTDLVLVGQSGVGKKTTLAAVYTAVYAALNAYVTALTAMTTAASGDVFYTIQGGVEKKVTLAQIATYIGVSVTGPAVSVVNHIPQFSDTAGGVLKDGLAVVTSVGVGGVDTSVPTEKAVRDALTARASFGGANTGIRVWNADQGKFHTLTVTGIAGAEVIHIGAGED